MHKEYDFFDNSCFAVCNDMSWTKDVTDLLEKYKSIGSFATDDNK